jgi:hypothetical protein
MRKVKKKNNPADTSSHAGELDILISLKKQISGRFSIEGVLESAIETTYGALAPDLAAIFLREKNKLELKKVCPMESNGGPEAPLFSGTVGCLLDLAADSATPVFSKELKEDSRCTCGRCRQSGFASVAA